MSQLLIFGLGYAANVVAERLRARGWIVVGTTRDGRGGTLRFDDDDGVRGAIAATSHVLSSVPPHGDGDPVLGRYAPLLGRARLSYLSSTGVYGDAGGAWVDETAPANRGRRANRNAADAAWLALGARVFRLPGIYGAGRSPFDRLREGKAHRVDVADQVFSRVHVDDLADGVIAGLDAPSGAYNLADDLPCSQNEVADYAAGLLGIAPPPFVPLGELSAMARSFYAENRRVSNLKAKRVLGWRPRYADYRLGLRALSATTSPAPASSAPPIASGDQR